MNKDDVLKIFEANKNYILKDIRTDEKPIAVILGGQPASGKGSISRLIEEEYPNKKFLIVNGDVFREYHPNHSTLIKNAESFSEKTQIFSNVFTEELIKTAGENKYNIIVEGTMRNPAVVECTALFFKEKGFSVEAHAVAAHPTITELNLYTRYAEEVRKHGTGRLADANIHNQAASGVGKTLDNLYINKSVDKINIYQQQADPVRTFRLNRGVSFNLQHDNWNNQNLPSHFVNKFRNESLKNVDLLKANLKNADRVKNVLTDGIIKQSFVKVFSNVGKLFDLASKAIKTFSQGLEM